MTAISYKLLNAQRFASVFNWSVRYSESDGNIFSEKFSKTKINSVLRRNKTVINIHNGTLYKRVTVKLYGGGVKVRDEVLGNEIKTKKQFLLQKGQFLYSRIDARNGAFGLANQEVHNAIVTNDFPVFDIDNEKIVPEYLSLITSSKAFSDFCQSLSSGTTGRQRISEDSFLDFEIPLPDLNTQNQLVNQYNQKLIQAQEAEKQADELEKGIEDYLLQELGIEKPKPVEKKQGLQLVSFKELSRWDCDFLENQWIFKLIIENGKYEPIYFGDILLNSQYGISEKSDAKAIGLPMLRMNNINHGELDISKLKYVEMKGDISKLLLKKGDLLFNRTNSKELVGKTAIFNLDEEYLFASYLIRLNLDTNKADVHYVNYLFNSSIIRTQINMISRQIIGQANINTTELKNFLFPLPPKDIQTQIVNHITSQKEQIKALRTRAEALRKQAKADFENEIFN